MHFRQHNLIVAALLILPGITNTSFRSHNTQATLYKDPLTMFPQSYDYTQTMPHKIMSYRLYLRPNSPFAESHNSHWSDEPNRSKGGKKPKRHNRRSFRRFFDRIAIEEVGRRCNIQKLHINSKKNIPLKKSFLENLFRSTYFIADTRSYENKELVETFDNEGPKFGRLKLVKKPYQQLPTDVLSKLEKDGCYCITPLSEDSFPVDLMNIVIYMTYNHKDGGLSAYVSKNNEAHLLALKQIGYEDDINDVPRGCKKLIFPEQKLISLCQNPDLPLGKDYPTLKRLSHLEKIIPLGKDYPKPNRRKRRR